MTCRLSQRCNRCTGASAPSWSAQAARSKPCFGMPWWTAPGSRPLGFQQDVLEGAATPPILPALDEKKKNSTPRYKGSETIGHAISQKKQQLLYAKKQLTWRPGFACCIRRHKVCLPDASLSDMSPHPRECNLAPTKYQSNSWAIRGSNCPQEDVKDRHEHSIVMRPQKVSTTNSSTKNLQTPPLSEGTE